MLKYLPIVFKNLMRNRRRTLLTVLSVGVSLFLLGVLLSVYAAFYYRDVPDERALRLITRHKVSLAVVVPEYYGERIRKIPGVQETCIINWFGGTYIDHRPEHMFPRFAVEPEKIFKVRSEFEMPPEQLQAFMDDRQGLAVAKSIADRIGLKLGQRITIKGDIYPVDLELTVRAIFDGPDANDTFFHWKYLQESLPPGWRGLVGLFAVQVAAPEDVPRVARAIDDQFRNSPAPTKTESEQAFMLSFINQLGNIKLFLLSITGAVVFTVLLVAANTMAMSVRERIREIGVMRTLGFTASGVLALVVSESVLIALAGGVIGVIGSYWAAKAMSDLMAAFFTDLFLPVWGVPFCLTVAVLIGVLSSIGPAAAAARTTIADALRHAG